MHLAGALEVNSANEAELDSVRGFGPEMTARILLAREQASFAGWSDLMQRVKGIKSGLATRLSANGLTVNGLTYGSTPIAPAPQIEPLTETSRP